MAWRQEQPIQWKCETEKETWWPRLTEMSWKRRHDFYRISNVGFGMASERESTLAIADIRLSNLLMCFFGQHLIVGQCWIT